MSESRDGVADDARLLDNSDGSGSDRSSKESGYVHSSSVFGKPNPGSISFGFIQNGGGEPDLLEVS